VTDPKHAWPPPCAIHRRRGGAHRAIVVRHPRRVVSAAMGLVGVLVVALTATMSPQAAVDAAVPPAQAAPSAPAPVFELPASSGAVVVWPVRAVADTDPIDPTTTEATVPVDVPATTVPATSEATTEGTADPVETPAPTTTQAPTRTHRPRPTPTSAPTPVSCSPGGVA
jgi:hypothetical protein